MIDESRALPAEMLQVVEVRAVRPFHLGDQRIEVGELVQVSKARAEYLRFVQLVEWV